MQVVILAAGKGLRLRPHTETTPKPLIDINNQPLLAHTLNSLPDKVDEIIIVIGYLGQQIKDYFGNEWQGKPITYVEQTELVGTGDALLRAKTLVKDRFLVVNGDDLYSKSDLSKLIEYEPSMLAWSSRGTAQYALAVDDNSFLTGFNPESTIINCGAYCLDTTFFENQLATITVHEKTEYSLPHTLEQITQSEPVKIIMATEWLPVGTPQQLDFARNYYIKKFNK